MSEIAGTARAHEAYAFCCMRCGYGWEQAYEIEHHIDGAGRQYVVYKAGGERVPSPLSSPTCMNCGGHVVRIMRAGQVSSVLGLMGRSATPEKSASSGPSAQENPVPPAGPMGVGNIPEPQHAGPPKRSHHWHLSDLLHPFHRK